MSEVINQFKDRLREADFKPIIALVVMFLLSVLLALSF